MFAAVERRFGRDISNISQPTAGSSLANFPAKQLPRSVAATCVAPTKVEIISENGVITCTEEESKESLYSPSSDDECLLSESSEDEYDDPMTVDENLLYDIDSMDKHDPFYVTEYVNEIYEYLHLKETELNLSSNYLSEVKTEIKPRQRDILVCWMAEIYVELKLLTETLFLATSIVDRLLSVKSVSLKKLQLVGLGAILLAAKYEETICISIKDLKVCADNAFSEEDILRVERVILKALEFDFSYPSPIVFLRRYSKAATADTLAHTLAKYISELSVTSYEMLEFLPSEIAAASVYMARKMLKLSPSWTLTLEHYTPYCEPELLPCARALNQIHFRDFQQLPAHYIESMPTRDLVSLL